MCCRCSSVSIMKRCHLALCGDVYARTATSVRQCFSIFGPGPNSSAADCEPPLNGTSIETVGDRRHKPILSQSRSMMGEAKLLILRDTFSTEDRSEWAPHGSGGMWRRRQTDDILRRHGVEPVNFERPPADTYPARLFRALWLKRRFGSS